MSVLRILSLSILLCLFSACAHQPPVPPLNLDQTLPDVAARYSTQRHHADGDSQNEWQFWRNAHRIEVNLPQQRTGEIWIKDNNTLFYQKLFHADRKIIEYQNDDLNALNIPVNWRTNQLMIDPATLQQLQRQDESWIDGHPTQTLHGTVNGIKYDVVWLVDLNLPYRLDKEDANGNAEHTRLLEIHTENPSALAAPDSRQYEVIDYADLGDRERDPFVIKVQNQWVGGHVHHH